ncbi:MAG: hypothetical protein RIB60_02170 [Phycisphaerales bacterium]
MDPIPPTYSFPPTAKPANGVRPAVPQTNARPGQSIDQVEVTARPKSALERLVAATVDKATINDTPVVPRPQTPSPSGSLELYAHPADKNAAATGVTLGRSIDVTG